MKADENRNWTVARMSLLLTCLVVLWVSPANADVYVQCPPDTDGVDTDGDGIVNNDHVCIHLVAGDGFVNMADGRSLYIFGFADATGVRNRTVMVKFMEAAEFPGPTIKVREGQKLYLTLTNVGMVRRPDLFDAHTVHWHGFPEAASVFDGVPSASLSINMGASLTYFYNVAEPGTYMYHCHFEATEHMQMGMLANLYVLPKQNNLPDGTVFPNRFVHHSGNKYVYNDGDGSTYYDVDYPIQLGSFDPDFHDASLNVQPLPFALMRDRYAMLNGRGYPDTINPAQLANSETGDLSQKISSLIIAQPGQKVLLRLSNLSTTDYFTVGALGIPMKVVGEAAKLLRGPDGKDLSYETSSVTIGGGESVDVILETADIQPGTYFFYTTNLKFLCNDKQDFGGMMTEIIIEELLAGPPADGATIALAKPLTFTWSYSGTRSLAFRVEVALQEADLGAGGKVSRTFGPTGGSSYTFVRRKFRRLKRFVKRAGSFYWRVVGTDPAGGPAIISDANHVSVQK